MTPNIPSAYPSGQPLLCTQVNSCEQILSSTWVRIFSFLHSLRRLARVVSSDLPLQLCRCFWGRQKEFVDTEKSLGRKPDEISAVTGYAGGIGTLSISYPILVGQIGSKWESENRWGTP